MAGRRPTPSHLKVVRGTDRPDRMNDREPRPERAVPDRPSWIKGREAAAAWRHITAILDRMGVLTEADSVAVEGLVVAYLEWRAAARSVLEDGFEKEDGKRSASSVAASDAWKRLRLMLVEFGMTPAARAKVKTAEDIDSQEQDAREFFGG